MSTSQHQAVRNYRSRLGQQGLARFEVLGRDGDQELIRALAKRLAKEGPDSARLRAAMDQALKSDLPEVGGILAALRRSPLVDADIVFERPFEQGRGVDF